MDRMEAGSVKLHVPKLVGVRRPMPGMFFHLTPELFLQTGGCTEFSCPGGRFSLRADELALIPSGVPHGERARNGRNTLFRALVVCLRSNEIRLIVTKNSLSRIPAIDFTDAFTTIEASRIIRYFDDAGGELSRTARHAKTRRRALLFAALSVVHEVVERGDRPNIVQSNCTPKVLRALELIHSNLHDPALSVTSMARQLGCTADHLSRSFRRETGIPALSFIRDERLHLAKELMQDLDLNISEIAWACGFSGLNYFVRVFRQATGRPPRLFREEIA